MDSQESSNAFTPNQEKPESGNSQLTMTPSVFQTGMTSPRQLGAEELKPTRASMP